MTTILRGDARALPLADESVDLICTSPPYFGLRSYTDHGEHYDAQIGAENSPALFVDALIDCTREMLRVLKPSGSIWINLGDKYAGSASGPRTPGADGYARDREPVQFQQRHEYCADVPAKSLLGIPWRYAIRAVDELGLILRAEVIWSKPNGLPESVSDRVRRSHEQWFHFTRSPRYFSAVDEIRRPHRRNWTPGCTGGRTYEAMTTPGDKDSNLAHSAPHQLGALPGSVWDIATQPLHVPEDLGVDHFAAFPMELPRRIITGWSPREVCTACGHGRRPVTEAQGQTPRQRLAVSEATHRGVEAGGQGLDFKGGHNTWRTFSITGYACACPETAAPTTPGVVLDPFGGTGTTALIADVHGRTGITLDASADYCRIAAWRTQDPKQRARAAGHDPTRVRTETTGQSSLFDLPTGGAA